MLQIQRDHIIDESRDSIVVVSSAEVTPLLKLVAIFLAKVDIKRDQMINDSCGLVGETNSP